MTKHTNIEKQLAEIQAKLESEDAVHGAIADQVRTAADKQVQILEKVLRHERHIDSHTGHLKELCVSVKSIQETLTVFQPIEGLAINVKTIADFGSIFWKAVKWLAVLIGGIALIWAAFNTGFKHP